MDFFRQPGESWTEKEVGTKEGYVKRIVSTVLCVLLGLYLILAPQLGRLTLTDDALRWAYTMCLCFMLVALGLIQPLRYLKTLRKLISERDGEPDREPPSEMLRSFISDYERQRDAKRPLGGPETQ